MLKRKQNAVLVFKLKLKFLRVDTGVKTTANIFRRLTVEMQIKFNAQQLCQNV
uniref:Uncharacterized protein n=1 Tax=Anguilla anguilla TaxID=7936 RepID=A0A0E9TBK3_ANGAN